LQGGLTMADLLIGDWLVGDFLVGWTPVGHPMPWGFPLGAATIASTGPRRI
jgi:hypothetical protein